MPARAVVLLLCLPELEALHQVTLSKSRPLSRPLFPPPKTGLMLSASQGCCEGEIQARLESPQHTVGSQ